MMKAVIDRFEGMFAVIVLEDDRRFSIPRKELPKGAKEGNWLQVEVMADEIKSITLDLAETQSAKKRIAEKLERLRKGEHLK